MVVVAFLLALVGGVSPLRAQKWVQSQAESPKPASEDKLIADLSSPDETVVVWAMANLKKEYRDSTNAVTAIKKLLTDSRLIVRERAAGALGVFHAEVKTEDVKAICALMKESNVDANMEGLKALRGVQGPAVAGAVPEVLPFLRNSNPYLIRDACRTLAVIGNKDLIPQIEPLLTHRQAPVRKDARIAITALRSKP